MKTLLALTLLITASIASAQVHVNGYTKKDGTYVAPHERTTPNNTMLDNYSTKGNVNPYTGQPGSKEPEPSGTLRPLPTTNLQPIQPTRSLAPAPQPIQQPANAFSLPQLPGNQF